MMTEEKGLSEVEDLTLLTMVFVFRTHAPGSIKRNSSP